MEITGSTTLYAIVADPISHVRTPQRFNTLLAEKGLNALMVPFHVPAEGLPVLLSGLRGLRNLAGMVVTVPHKEKVAALCDTLTPAAQMIGAVNAIRVKNGHLTGGNFDGLGFVAGLRSQGIQPEGRHVYLAGLGGAGKAIACAIAEAQPASLRLYNRTQEKAEAYAAYLREHYVGLDVRACREEPQGADLAINATSLGLLDTDPLPFSLDDLADSAVVADAVMKTEHTPLLRAAAEQGYRAHAGRHMLEGQITEIAQFLGI